ncbi:hypothetical protein DM860_007591 [Cuscuta australis]|uniref:SNRNP25 ubiquitin-like domain-containing protein n=1 Tax=Cuscuta australis TaxID=267555 RepID=A0A328E8J1_9ASTE|nr:hypothetical protein DM860_007591 [Cuscuta australis]
MQAYDESGNSTPMVTFQRNGSLSCPVQFLCHENSNSFSYTMIPPRPLKLTVLKLDGSSFEIEVPRNGTVADLKKAVEAAFSHLPCKVSWRHVWGHFCLSHDYEKLLCDTDHIGLHGIRDGDQLEFVRHVSVSYLGKKQEREDLEACLLLDNCEKRLQRKERDKPFFFSNQIYPFSLLQQTQKVEEGRRRRRRAAMAVANMIMASSKALMPPPTLLPTPRFKVSSLFPKLPFPQFPRPIQTLKSLPLILASALAAAPPPSMAEEMQKASLFDFNLTLPIMMVQFLLLMVALDKIYYSPLGKFMDERDAAIKDKLNRAKEMSEEARRLDEQAAAVMSAAREEIAAALRQKRTETQAEMEKRLEEGRAKVEAELAAALEQLEVQKMETMKQLESQISSLSDEIVKKVLPA